MTLGTLMAATGGFIQGMVYAHAFRKTLPRLNLWLCLTLSTVCVCAVNWLLMASVRH